MGYCSEVAIVIKKEDYENHFKGVEQLKDLLEIGKIITREDLVIIHWDWIKWYDSFPEIQLVNQILDYMENQENHPYSFTRIGEEDGDIETQYYAGKNEEYLCEYNYPVTYIDIPHDWEEIE